jgi:protein-S-isoprenylcysteine O-methyltransferase Ste14
VLNYLWSNHDDELGDHYGANNMAAMMILAYGAMVYVVFLATLLYSVGFVGDLGGARSIDHGTAAAFGQALLADLILLSLFAVQHSTMARQAFKRWWTRLIPPAAERSTYVLLSSLLLALLFWRWRPLPEAVWGVGGWRAIVLQGLFGVDGCSC